MGERGRSKGKDWEKGKVLVMKKEEPRFVGIASIGPRHIPC